MYNVHVYSSMYHLIGMYDLKSTGSYMYFVSMSRFSTCIIIRDLLSTNYMYI